MGAKMDQYHKDFPLSFSQIISRLTLMGKWHNGYKKDAISHTFSHDAKSGHCNQWEKNVMPMADASLTFSCFNKHQYHLMVATFSA